MTCADSARQAALDRVGDAYVYGAWDQFCTVQSRNKYANLSATYAEAIKKECQRQNGSRSTCDECRYNGRRIHDCRGLTNACAKVSGIKVDGETVAAQWKADNWSRKGTIDILPAELPYVQLFRYNGTKWAHTGIYIGSGETVDARGHANGVIRARLDSYKWTHWAIPKGMYEIASEPKGGKTVIWTGIVATESGRLFIRNAPGFKEDGKTPVGDKIGSLQKGEEVDVFAETDGWAFIAGDGLQGYVCMKYLIKATERAQDASNKQDDKTQAERETAQPGPSPDARWAILIQFDTEEEALQYARNSKRAIVIRYEKPPDERGGEGE